LREGDVLKKFDGAEVKDREGLLKALRKSKAGQEYDIVVQRGEKTVKLKLTPEKR
jgi:S1-C subfamily serine protease